METEVISGRLLFTYAIFLKITSDIISVFDSIKPILTEEPTSGDITRIQFRLPDGSRVVRKFLKTSIIRNLFEFIKATNPPQENSAFELINVRDPLLSKIDQTLEQAKVLNSSLTVEIQ